MPNAGPVNGGSSGKIPLLCVGLSLWTPTGITAPRHIVRSFGALQSPALRSMSETLELYQARLYILLMDCQSRLREQGTERTAGGTTADSTSGQHAQTPRQQIPTIVGGGERGEAVVVHHDRSGRRI